MKQAAQTSKTQYNYPQFQNHLDIPDGFVRRGGWLYGGNKFWYCKWWDESIDAIWDLRKKYMEEQNRIRQKSWAIRASIK